MISPSKKKNERAKRGEYTLQETAAKLGLRPMAVLRMIRTGNLKAEQYSKGTPWIIRHEDIERADIRTIPAGRIRSNITSQDQQTRFFNNIGGRCYVMRSAAPIRSGLWRCLIQSHLPSFMKRVRSRPRVARKSRSRSGRYDVVWRLALWPRSASDGALSPPVPGRNGFCLRRVDFENAEACSESLFRMRPAGKDGDDEPLGLWTDRRPSA